MEHVSKNLIRQTQKLATKKYRDESLCFVAEGDKCIQELLSQPATFPLRYLILEKTSKIIPPPNAITYSADYTEIKQMSSFVTPPTSIAVFEQKNFPLPTSFPHNQPILCLDNIQDPGNLGTIIRTANWFGLSYIICSPTTANLYNPKVVQSSMGALAKIKLVYTDLLEWLNSMKTAKPIFGLDTKGSNLFHYHSKLQLKNSILVLGNEGNGISSNIKQTIPTLLAIPPQNNNAVESLNVAITTAITLTYINNC